MEPRGIPQDATDMLHHIFIENVDWIPLCKCTLTPEDLHSQTYLFDYEINNLDIKNSEGLVELKELVGRVHSNFPGLQARFIIAFDN